MKAWKIAAACSAMLVAAGVGAAFAPVTSGQTVVRRAQPSVEIFTSGSRIGVSLRDVDEADVKTLKLQTAAGAVIEEVSEESPAAKAGMRKGDVIVEFDGERVRSVRQLTRLVQDTPGGRKISTVLMRDGQRVTLTVEPSSSDFRFDAFRSLDGFRSTPKRVPSTPFARAPVPDAFSHLLGHSSLGITLQTLTPQLGDYFGAKEGALVTSVTDDSPAAKAGVKAGDVITSFNGVAVDDPSDIRRRSSSLEDGEEFTLGIVRDRKPMTLKGKVESMRPRRTYRSIV
jgi:serine protease Do